MRQPVILSSWLSIHIIVRFYIYDDEPTWTTASLDTKHDSQMKILANQEGYLKHLTLGATIGYSSGRKSSNLKTPPGLNINSYV